MPSSLHSYIEVKENSHFPLQNLPYGIFSSPNNSTKRGATILGDQVIDLALLEQHGLFLEYYPQELALFSQPTLNQFIAQPKALQQKIRLGLQQLLQKDNPLLRDHPILRQQVFHAYANVTMHMPGIIPDYTDFYSSIDHATNVGILFRDKDNPLLPNYKHIPVGYHGRSSSIVISGTTIKRPHGQVLPKDAVDPIFSATKALDFELEMAFFMGQGNQLGHPIPIANTYDHIFGLVILNDWSARDIQKWEYVPLGPFLSKSFATSISPWIVTLEALAPFKVTPRKQDPQPLPYLQYAHDFSLDIQLEVAIKTATMVQEEIISLSNFSYLYWTMAQQLAHHTVAGCNTQTMDLMASGTLSGPETKNLGCLLEMTAGGAQPLRLENGEQRMYLQDGDEVIMRAYCQADGYRIGFGEVRGKITA